MSPNPSKTYPRAGKNFRLLRFPLTCSIRLLRAGNWIGEFQTSEISCHGFCCLVPRQLIGGSLSPGMQLDCEIDLPGRGQDALRLSARATVLGITPAAPGLASLNCRIISYHLL